MENETLTLIKTRRSIRSYKEDLVPAEMLNAILEAGTYAPTGGGRQSPCILRSPADFDAFQSGRCAEHNGRPESLVIMD